MQKAPPRVLHIVENLNHGAVENWLVRMLAHARKRGIAVDWSFYCALAARGAIEDKANSLGARVIHSPVPIKRKATFIRALRSELRHGHYDVLHCHHDLINAVYLLAAIGLPLRKRIVHVHNADEAVLTPSRMKQSLYREPMRHIGLTLSDLIVGISHHTLDTFLDGRPRRAGRDVVHYYGIDSIAFEQVAANRSCFRRQLNLREDALILLFAGRIVPEKNPVFAVDVLANLRQIEPRGVAVFAGTGSLEEKVMRRAHELGVEDSVRLLGWRDDLPEIMSCSDWFILPHPEERMEGFGLVIVEAQLAGLRMLLSQGIADDPLLPAASFRRLPLSAGPKAWAEAAADLLRPPAPSRAAALAALRDSSMDMDKALDGLLRLYAYNGCASD